MSSTEPPSAPPTPPLPPQPAESARIAPSAFGTLALVAGPGLAILLIGLALGKKGEEIAIILILGIGILGTLVGGILGGLRLARTFAGSKPPTTLASVGCCFLCMGVSALLSFGGCAVGVLSSLRFQ